MRLTNRLFQVKFRRLAICLLLAAVLLLAFLPVLRNNFTGYDDPDYVINNRTPGAHRELGSN